MSSGDRQRPVFTFMLMPLLTTDPTPPAIAIFGADPTPTPPDKEARLLWEGLGVRMTLTSAEAGLLQRASSEMVRMGLGDRARWWGNAESLGSELRPSGPNVLIWGEEPRCP